MIKMDNKDYWTCTWHETLLNVICHSGWEGGLGENEYICTYGWVLCCSSETVTTLLISYVCVRVLVAQLCLTLCNTMDCSPPGSSVHEILQARMECHSLFHRIFLTQGLNLGRLHCRQILYCLSCQGNPLISSTLIQDKCLKFEKKGIAL